MIFKQKKEATAAAQSEQSDDEEELLMVLMAAIKAYEGGQSHTIIRNVGGDHHVSGNIEAVNPFIRDC